MTSPVKDHLEILVMSLFTTSPDDNVIDQNCTWVASSIVCWNTSLAELISNDILRKLNLLNGVLNVVTLVGYLCRGICQMLLFASNVENTVECGICAVTSSMVVWALEHVV